LLVGQDVGIIAVMTRKPEKPKARTSRRKLPKPGTAQAYTNVLLEDIRTQVQLAVEVANGTREALERKIEESHRQLSMRMDVIEGAVRENGDDIRKNSEDIRKNSEDIRTLVERVDTLTESVKELSMTARAHDSRLDRLEERVGTLQPTGA